jgi:hypothetical protein
MCGTPTLAVPTSSIRDTSAWRASELDTTHITSDVVVEKLVGGRVLMAAHILVRRFLLHRACIPVMQ